jgi:cytoskeletal protein RodZ
VKIKGFLRSLSSILLIIIIIISPIVDSIAYGISASNTVVTKDIKTEEAVIEDGAVKTSNNTSSNNPNNILNNNPNNNSNNTTDTGLGTQITDDKNVQTQKTTTGGETGQPLVEKQENQTDGKKAAEQSAASTDTQAPLAPTTPVLSTEAFHFKETLLSVFDTKDRLLGAKGAWVSVGAPLCSVAFLPSVWFSCFPTGGWPVSPPVVVF